MNRTERAVIVWKPQPRQLEFMRRPEPEALYGGAAGGGKSDALLIEALRQVHIPHYRALILRKTYPQLSDLVDKSQMYYRRAFPEAQYNATSHVWVFPSGAKIWFGSMQYTKDRTNYQGKAYDFIGFDELTHFEWDEYSYMMSRNRPTGPGTRVYMRATTNPGGIGHGWVKARFITPAPPGTPIVETVTVRLPDGTEATVPAEHAAAIYVNEQPAFRVVCTPALLPQLALGRLLTEGWIASADEVEQIAVCAEGAKVQVYLRHPLSTRRAAAQEVASCCTDNIALGSPVELLPLRPVPGLDLQPEWVERLTAAMHAGLPLYRATRAVHSCFVLHKGEIVFACEDLGRHNALDKAVGCAVLAGLPLAECVLYTSGRVPLDMVRKAIRAGVPVLVSKSMPTVQSAELAAEYGLQLVCGRKFPKV